MPSRSRSWAAASADTPSVAVNAVETQLFGSVKALLGPSGPSRSSSARRNSLPASKLSASRLTYHRQSISLVQAALRQPALRLHREVLRPLVSHAPAPFLKAVSQLQLVASHNNSLRSSQDIEQVHTLKPLQPAHQQHPAQVDSIPKQALQLQKVTERQGKMLLEKIQSQREPAIDAGMSGAKLGTRPTA